MFHRDGPTFFELAVQALSSTEHGYDLIARKFDHTPFRTPDFIVQHCRPYFGSPEFALDLCCGTGAALPFLAEHARHAIGIDVSRGMLLRARELHPRTNLSLVRGDVLALPFGSIFDLVTCFGAFGHILEQDEERFVTELVRVLRPGGRFVFVTAEKPSVMDPGVWLARGFNAAMHIRNAIWSPKFIMYYLTFLLPRAQELLEAAGCDVQVHAPFARPYSRLRIVVATKRAC